MHMKSARSTALRSPGQGVKCLQMCARLRVPIGTPHLEHDGASNADPLYLGIAKSLCARLAAI